jgi:hypothetical protein
MLRGRQNYRMGSRFSSKIVMKRHNTIRIFFNRVVTQRKMRDLKSRGKNYSMASVESGPRLRTQKT